MAEERSCGAIIFFEGKERKYLLLHYRYKTEYWDFVKGNIEQGESEKETAAREAREETGISDLKFAERFKEKISYVYRRDERLISKQVVFMLAETKTNDVKLSEEHIGYEWLPYKEAVERVSFKNSKDVLTKAEAFLGKYGRQKTLV